MLVATGGAAQPFVPPTEANSPFRRDKLPIDVDSMALLSREMERLSQNASLENAAQRRAAAQALALALALDPANSTARSTLSDLAKGKVSDHDTESLTHAKARIWQFYGWLASPDAGVDGNLLADLIGDTAAALDPENPSAVILRATGERGKWAGWIAPLFAFEEDTSVSTPHPRDIPRDALITEPSAQTARISLNEASVKTVLYVYDKDRDTNGLVHTVVRMEARAEDSSAESVTQESAEEAVETGRDLSLEIPCGDGFERDVQDFIANPIRRALEAVGALMPKGGRITLLAGDGDTYSFRRNTNALSGAGFVLAHAALTGSIPDATVIGVIDSQGQIAPPAYFWYYLNILREGKGGRLVIPAAAEEYLLALLTFEEPDFFLKYEVLTASTPKEFVELTAKASTDKQASISTRFQEICDKAPTNSLGPYLANRFVRQRLLEIYADMPQHLSAKMLAIQGSAERPPRTLSRKILASIIWHAVAPINSTLNVEIFALDDAGIAAMEKSHQEARATLDRLDRLTERADTELLTRAKSMTSDLRSLTRALRSRSGDYRARYSSISKGFTTTKKSNSDLREDLSQITGDPLPEDSIKRIRNERDRFRNR